MRKIFALALSLILLLSSTTSCGIVEADHGASTPTPLDQLTFRAEVLEFEPSLSVWNQESILFVSSITEVMGHPAGGRYFIRRNDFVVALDAQGWAIPYCDIPPGAIVDIKIYGHVLQSDPAIIPSAISIQIVE